MKKAVVAIIGITTIMIVVFALVFLLPGQGLTVGYAALVQDNHAFVTDNDGVTILDISEPSRSRKVGRLALADGAFGVCLENNLLYIAADEEGFAIADISDVTNPVTLGEYFTGGSAYEVAVEGSYAYVSVLNSGLQVLNISNPESITKMGELGNLGRGDDVEAHQGLVYFGDGSGGSSGLKIVDVSDPSTPALIKSVQGTAGVFDIHIHGDLMFLACHSLGARILNISNPWSPTVISTYVKTGGEAYGVAGNNTHVYVADLQKGAYLLDITDPSNPSEIASYSNAAPHGIFTDGEYIYLADQDNGLIILDLDLSSVYDGYAAVPGFDSSFIPIGLVSLLVISKRRIRKPKR
ncbi:MAG: LVIVD repeat-containing protein [Candidatus Odinarchaeota archaeon]